jgi:hypothetical protein
MLNTLSPVLGGSLDLDHLSPKSLGRVSGRTSTPGHRYARSPENVLNLAAVTPPPA